MQLDEKNTQFYGSFAKYRETLDYNWHQIYSQERQLLQDDLISPLFKSKKPEKNPWAIFTCGCMGSGKSHALKYLHSRRLIDLDKFVKIDPDELRFFLPEIKKLIADDPSTAGAKTHAEVSSMSEIAQWAALDRSVNFIVDGTLRDSVWYSKMFRVIRERYSHYKIAILRVDAKFENIQKRVEDRAKQTVPLELLRSTYEMIPYSFSVLAPLSDYSCIIDTNGDYPKFVEVTVSTHPLFSHSETSSL